MSLNNTPKAERIHIGIFGKRNAGKSSLINAITGQDLAIVSEIKGTTTDPVSKAMELLPLGPVVMIDTPGLDDEGELGAMRVKKAYQVLNKTDVAILTVDAQCGLTEAEERLVAKFAEKNIPYLIVMNKADLADVTPVDTDEHTLYVSAATGVGIYELKERLARMAPTEDPDRRIIADLLSEGDVVVLVVPIDSAAPKGRLILPQQQTIRDCLEAGALSVVCRETELPRALRALEKPPRIVVTDSQAFERVAKDTPPDVPLTSFSILFSRYKGTLQPQLRGIDAVEQLQDGDRVLIAEGCTHHRQCDDIGTVKLPRWITEHTGKQIEFVFTSGTEFPLDLTPYKMVVHCGGCMLNEREMRYRIACCEDQGVPVVNYGLLIAHLKGVLARSVAPILPDAHQ